MTVTDFQRVIEVARELPEAELGESWGTESFKVRGKMFLRRHEEPGLVVLKVTKEEREALTAERPETFLVTPHYENYAYMLVRTADLDSNELRELVTEAWRMTAPQRLVKAFDAEHGA